MNTCPVACLAPPNRASFNSTHVYGTRVPVEEPSTVSIADISPTMVELCGGRNCVQFVPHDVEHQHCAHEVVHADEEGLRHQLSVPPPLLSGPSMLMSPLWPHELDPDVLMGNWN